MKFNFYQVTTFTIIQKIICILLQCKKPSSFGWSKICGCGLATIVYWQNSQSTLPYRQYREWAIENFPWRFWVLILLIPQKNVQTGRFLLEVGYFFSLFTEMSLESRCSGVHKPLEFYKGKGTSVYIFLSLDVPY